MAKTTTDRAATARLDEIEKLKKQLAEGDRALSEATSAFNELQSDLRDAAFVLKDAATRARVAGDFCKLAGAHNVAGDLYASANFSASKVEHFERNGNLPANVIAEQALPF